MSALESVLGLMRARLSTPQIVAVSVIPVLFAITLHEVSHGFVAKLLGDRTAQMLGRLTVNPVKHIDPIGTVLLPAALIFMGAPVFGWAKPVPVSMQNFRDPRKGMAIVAVAGPASNLLMAIFWAIILRLGLVLGPQGSNAAEALFFAGAVGIYANLVLMLLNMLPIPPLDGGRLTSGLLPGPISAKYDRIEPWGFPILVLLLFTGVLGLVLWPALNFLFTILSGI